MKIFISWANNSVTRGLTKLFKLSRDSARETCNSWRDNGLCRKKFLGISCYYIGDPNLVIGTGGPWFYGLFWLEGKLLLGELGNLSSRTNRLKCFYCDWVVFVWERGDVATRSKECSAGLKNITWLTFSNILLLLALFTVINYLERTAWTG